MKNLFIIGDIIGDSERDENTVKLLSSFPDVSQISYDSFFAHKKPITLDDAMVYFDFPYTLWDDIVETGNRLYGCDGYGDSINELADILSNQAYDRFPNASFVNQPDAISLERDKVATKKMVKDAGVSVPELIDKNVDVVLNELANGAKLYAKVRYGSLGKGITYLTPTSWKTNFKYSNGIISNHSHDHKWYETDVTDDVDFLKKLFEKNVFVERAIINPLTNGKKFGMRFYSVFHETNPAFAYASMADGQITTGAVSGGARFVPFSKMHEYVPQGSLDESLIVSSKASKALGLNYTGIDIFFNGNNFDPMFLEANSFPGTRNKSNEDRYKLLTSLYAGMGGSHALSHNRS